LPKIGIANRAGFNQLNGHTKKPLQVLLQSKEIVRMLSRTHRLELDKEIKVAGRDVEPTARCRAKQSQATHAAVVAQRHQVLDLFLHNRRHRSLFLYHTSVRGAYIGLPRVRCQKWRTWGGPVLWVHGARA